MRFGVCFAIKSYAYFLIFGENLPMFLFVLCAIGVIALVAILGSGTNSPVPKSQSGTMEIDVPNPTVVSPERFLDFIEKTPSDQLWEVYKKLESNNLLKNLALKKAIYDKARFDVFDREYYNSCFLEKMENVGFNIREIFYHYTFSFPLILKDESCQGFLKETSFVGKNVTVVKKKELFVVRLINKEIGYAPEEYAQKLESSLLYNCYFVIEKLPSEECECFISVNVSNEKAQLKRNPEDKIFSVEGAFVKNRKSYINSYCMKGDAINFENEPNNVHDHNAIKIIHNKKQIGYVSRSHQVLVKRLLNKGFVAKLHEIKYDGFRIDVYYKFS